MAIPQSAPVTDTSFHNGHFVLPPERGNKAVPKPSASRKRQPLKPLTQKVVKSIGLKRCQNVPGPDASVFPASLEENTTTTLPDLGQFENLTQDSFQPIDEPASPVPDTCALRSDACVQVDETMLPDTDHISSLPWKGLTKEQLSRKEGLVDDLEKFYTTEVPGLLKTIAHKWGFPDEYVCGLVKNTKISKEHKPVRHNAVLRFMSQKYNAGTFSHLRYVRILIPYRPP